MYAHDITHILPIPAQPVTYRHNVHVQSLRTCLFSSDAAQWWPGVWGWTGPAGHGLDTRAGGHEENAREGGPWGVLGRRVYT
jgi:hypothetical protein